METVTGNATPSGLEAYELEREIGADHKQALTTVKTAIRVVEPVVIAGRHGGRDVRRRAGRRDRQR